MKYLLIVSISLIALISARGQPNSKLLFREDWKEIEAALPVTQEHVANPDLILSLHGPAKDNIKKSNHPNIPNDPYYIWSGDCKSNWAVSLRKNHETVNLSGNSRIVVRSKQTGFRQLRLILKLNDDNWLVSDQYAGFTEDWSEKEFKIAEVKWRKLNIDNITEGPWVQGPDLVNVKEIGFTDLMAGGGTPASSRLDWIAVYGN